MKRLTIWVLVLTLCLAAAGPALAANVFLFTEKEIKVFEGETCQTELRREGNYDGEGQIVYSCANPAIATVSGDGMVTAVGKGRTQVVAQLMRDGRQVGKATAVVNVLRAVTKVTLNTTKLSVYEPDDPAVSGLLKEPEDETELAELAKRQVLVVPAGTVITLAATCTPKDASNLKVQFTSTDVGVANVTGTSMKAIQKGECDLIVSSVQNPEVTEVFRVLVIQQIKQIQINSTSKQVAAGSTMQLTATCLPDNASIPKVTWSSRAPAVATVDENGVVTGLKRGSAMIIATAADGGRAAQNITISVTQPVTGVAITQAEIPVIVGRNAMAKATVMPTDATDRTVTWSTSDTSIATVNKYGQLTGVKAGECTVIATSNSNPEVQAEARVVVSQLVTKIENVNNQSELTLRVGEVVQTRWNVLPDDATDKELTFRSNYPKLASVNESGLVTALNRGVATIVATAKDAGRRQGNVKITVIQPVTGVSVRNPLYYIQRGSYGYPRADVQPNNANNKNVTWYSENEYVAAIVSGKANPGKVSGVSNGVTTITAVTEDGGFIASAQVKVADFNHAIQIDDLYVNSDNKIKIVLRNGSQDLNITHVYCTVACYDENEDPFICNTDGERLDFDVEYPKTLMPYDRTIHGSFNFKNWVVDRTLGAVVLTVVAWKDDNGIKYTIPEQYRPQKEWTRRLYNRITEGDGVG